jgi:hypothetical protein
VTRSSVVLSVVAAVALAFPACGDEESGPTTSAPTKAELLELQDRVAADRDRDALDINQDYSIGIDEERGVVYVELAAKTNELVERFAAEYGPRVEVREGELPVLERR